MPKKIWLILIGMIINVVGSSFLWPFNTIYIHYHLGRSLAMAGVVLMFNSIAGIIGNMVGGFMFDRFGGYKTILAGVFVTFTASVFLAFRHDFLFYFICLIFIGFGGGVIFPSMYALIGIVWKEGERKAFNALYVAQNVGISAGTALSGFVASVAIEYIFFANVILYGLFFLLVAVGFRHMDVIAVKKEKVKKEAFVMTPSLRAVGIVGSAFALCWFTYVQWQAPIATHIQDLTSLRAYSLLWTINGALIVLAQPIVSKVIQKFVASLKYQVVTGIVIFMISFITVSQAQNFTGFVVAMVILTLGEMFVWPAIPTIANQLAPANQVGFYQGLVNSFATGGRMFAPLLGGLLVDIFHLQALYIVLLAVLGVAIVATLLYDKKIENIEETMKAA